MKLTNRIALITGGAGVIGSAIGRTLAGEGANVALGDLKPPIGPAKDIEGLGREALALEVDVTDSDSVRRMVEATVERFGRIDILATVAGVTSLGAFGDLAEPEWDRVIDINLKGVFLCCQAVLPVMRKQGYGRIVNMGSLVAKNGGNPRPWIDPGEQKGSANVAYGASKAGVHAITFFLAKETAHQGITVNALAPGPIASPMTTKLSAAVLRNIPVGRIGRAEEVAETVLFLAGENAGFITGEVIDMNGGVWMD